MDTRYVLPILLLVFLFMSGVFIVLPSHVFTSSAQSSATSLPSSPCLPATLSDVSTALVQPSSTNATMSGYVAPSVQSGVAQYTGDLNQSQTVRIELVLALRNSPQFQACAASISDPNSPNYRHFLNASTLSPYLPTTGDKASVISFLRHGGFATSNGFSPVVIDATGTVSAAEKLFGVNFGLYKQGNSTFYAPSSNPKFPVNYVSLITGITGLDNYSVAKPMLTLTCGSPLGTPGSEYYYPECPQGIQSGYSLSSLFTNGYNGAGVKVAIVDVAGDQNIQTSLDTFSSQFGLPSTTLSIIYPDGTPNYWDPGWASEESMDAEAVHTAAPGASIVLAIVNASNDPLDAIDYIATNHLASIVSNSWGYSAPDYQLGSSFLTAEGERLALDTAQGLTILFSSGDNGAYPDNVNLGTDFPASDPNVLAVGATNLNLAGCDGTTCTGYQNETGGFISGGGYSGYFPEPIWQTSTIGTIPGRGVPDVSMEGATPGIWVYSTLSDACGYNPPNVYVDSWFDCSGTSLSTPLWAGFLATALQEKGTGSFGNIDPLIYQIGDGASYSLFFHDITIGSNPGGTSNGGYSAGVGWDPVTGWGSPNASALAAALASIGCDPGVIPPTITSVTGTIEPSAGDGAWSITINGGCFGNTFPTTESPTGDGSITTQPNASTPAIILTDQNSGWGAGFGGDLIGIYLTSWTNNSITISGFGSTSGVGYGGSYPYQIAPGDQIGIYIVGPGCGTSTSPPWPSGASSPPPASNWPSNCEVGAFTTVSGILVAPEFPIGTLVSVLAPLAAAGIFVVSKKGKGLSWSRF